MSANLTLAKRTWRIVDDATDLQSAGVCATPNACDRQKYDWVEKHIMHGVKLDDPEESEDNAPTSMGLDPLRREPSPTCGWDNY